MSAKHLRHATLALATLSFAAFGSAQTVIGNFETPSLDGWGTNGSPGNPVLSKSNIGVTLGNYSLDSSIAQGSFWGPTTGNLVTEGLTGALENASRLSLDVTMDSQYLNGGTGNFNGFAQSNAVAIQLLSPSSGSNLDVMIQENWGAAGVSDSSGERGQWNGNDGTRHLVWNLNNFTAKDPNSGATLSVSQFLQKYSDISSVQIDFLEQVEGGTRTVGDAQMFFDNVRLNAVPEPSQFAFLGLGVLALLKARKR